MPQHRIQPLGRSVGPGRLFESLADAGQSFQRHGGGEAGHGRERRGGVVGEGQDPGDGQAQDRALQHGQPAGSGDGVGA
jgi:hypothetical protein